MAENSGVWTLTVCLVPGGYPRQKTPKMVDTHKLEYVPKDSSPGVALDGLIEQVKDINDEDAEDDHVAWLQFSYHDEYEFDERNPDWSYSHQFRRSTKVWNVRPLSEALELFRGLVMKEEEGPSTD